MCNRCLFRKGISPCDAMKARQASAKPRKALKADEDQQFLDEFLVQVRAELAEIRSRVDGQPKGGSRQIK